MNKTKFKNLIELYWVFFKIGLFTFGGGLSMLPMLTKECVEKHKWVTEDEILEYYAIGQCTPGVIAVNTATFIGYKEYGWIGALFTTVGVVTPSLIIICLIAAVLRPFMDNPWLLHAFAGIRVSVCAMLIIIICKMAYKSIKDYFGAAIFLVGIILCLFTPVPIVVIVLAAAVAGIIYKIILNRSKDK